MLRREFIRGVGGVGASIMAPGLSAANRSNATTAHSEPPTNELSAFKSSFLNVPESYGPTHISFDKPLPKGLVGTLFRNGPALFKRGDTEYKHWFDGDGMVQSFYMQGSSLIHKARMVQTERFIAEKEAGRFLWPAFGTAFEDGRSATGADEVNSANISVLPVQDELWALWEGGSAWALDLETLETRGRKVFSEQTDGLSFSAHPKVDQDGRIWNFGYVSGADTLIIYDLNANGQLNRVQTINTPYTNMVHDFAMTEQYLIFVLLPLTFSWPDNSKPVAFADMIGWDDSEPVNVLVVNKSTLEVEQRFEMPSFFAFHFGNAWQDGKQVRVELATSDPWDALNEQFLRATQGHALNQCAFDAENAPAAIELVIDMHKKRVSVERLPIVGADFPVYDNRFVGSRTSHLFMTNRSSTLSRNVFGFNQLIRFDRASGNTQLYDYGANVLAEEHLFVPRKGGAEGIGWLIGSSYDWQERVTSLSVFNASAIADGPVATAVLPYHLPLGLHGKFVAG